MNGAYAITYFAPQCRDARETDLRLPAAQARSRGAHHPGHCRVRRHDPGAGAGRGAGDPQPDPTGPVRSLAALGPAAGHGGRRAASAPVTHAHPTAAVPGPHPAAGSGPPEHCRRGARRPEWRAARHPRPVARRDEAPPEAMPEAQAQEAPQAAPQGALPPAPPCDPAAAQAPCSQAPCSEAPGSAAGPAGRWRRRRARRVPEPAVRPRPRRRSRQPARPSVGSPRPGRPPPPRRSPQPRAGSSPGSSPGSARGRAPRPRRPAGRRLPERGQGG
jgi:hypothetical protein